MFKNLFSWSSTLNCNKLGHFPMARILCITYYLLLVLAPNVEKYFSLQKNYCISSFCAFLLVYFFLYFPVKLLVNVKNHFSCSSTLISNKLGHFPMARMLCITYYLLLGLAANIEKYFSLQKNQLLSGFRAFLLVCYLQVKLLDNVKNFLSRPWTLNSNKLVHFPMARILCITYYLLLGLAVNVEKYFSLQKNQLLSRFRAFLLVCYLQVKLLVNVKNLFSQSLILNCNKLGNFPMARILCITYYLLLGLAVNVEKYFFFVEKLASFQLSCILTSVLFASKTISHC